MQYEDLLDAPGDPSPSPKSPPRDASAISQNASDFEDLLTDSTASMDVDAGWLFKHAGEVFGPITTKVLLEKLYAGELTGETLISPEEGEFMALRRYGAFRSHLPKADEHRKHLEEVARTERKARNAAVRRRLAIMIAASIVGVAVFATTIYFIRAHRAERVALEEEKTLEAALESLMATVTIEPPLAEVEDDEPTTPDSTGKRKRRRRSRSVARFSGGKGGTGELSRSEIMEGVASVFGGFKTCIVQQIQRDRDSVPERIVLMFTIENSGTVRDTNLDDRILRSGPLKTCMARRIESVRYRKFKGEVRNVEYPITIGPR